MTQSPLAVLRRAFHNFFPPACAGCEATAAKDRAFCPLCEPLAPRLTPPYCARCAVPMRQFSSRADQFSECSRCRKNPPTFEVMNARWEYDDAVADAIRRIKYGEDFPALRALCRGARRWFRAQIGAAPAASPIVPVPSHRSELRKRGFHLPTAALRLLLPRSEQGRIDHRLRKTRPTPRQASLPLASRRANVVGVFRDTGATTMSSTALLFDDVSTTGSTADAACKALSDAGFRQIRVLVLARAPRPRSTPA